jgi:uncharacterized protein (UPF0216 family)
MLRDEIRRLNTHLPTNRKALSRLLEQDSPTVPSVGGQEIRLRKDELEDLAATLPDEAKELIRLPLVLFRRKELGPGAYTILGDPYEEYAVALLTGSFGGAFQEFREQRPDPVVFYKPQVSELLRRFHSLVVIGFGV